MLAPRCDASDVIRPAAPAAHATSTGVLARDTGRHPHLAPSPTGAFPVIALCVVRAGLFSPVQQLVHSLPEQIRVNA